MSRGNSSVLIGSCCTKSVRGATVSVLGPVSVIVGTEGIVSVTGCGCCGTTFGAFLGHATPKIDKATTAMPQRNALTVLLIAIALLISRPKPMISLDFLRPVGVLVLAGKGQLQQIRPVDAHLVDLPLTAAIRLKREPPAVRRPRWLFVGRFACHHAAFVGEQIHDPDLKPATDLRGVGELLAVRRPGGVVGPVAFE